jgi:simple sugar transport system permease protein
MLWAAIPAFLRTRFNANEILTSLMLVYVATLTLSLLVHGAWRDPEGFNFPQSRMFGDAALLPILMPDTRLNIGLPLALAVVAMAWLFMRRSLAGFQMRVAGLAPAAAIYAGISSRRTIWLGMLIGGACAGLAGVGEVAGPLGQLLPSASPGYGFARSSSRSSAACIRSGIVLASLLMSLLYLGGESAQINLAMPSRRHRAVQGTLLFFLLAADVFIHYRLRAVRGPARGARLLDPLMDQLAQLIVLTLAAGTPLVYAALGELVTEKSGVLNLGVEGMMLAGAVTSFIVAATTHSAWLGVAAGMAAGAALSLIFGVLTLSLMANQVASGLALSLFGIGLSAFVGLDYVSVVIEPITPLDIPALTNLPVVGKLLFGHNPLVYLSIVLLMAIQWFLYRTRAGLIVRAVGESPQSAHAIGFPVARIRYCAVMFGGACAGLGGAYMAVAYTPLWVEGMTAGRGWIAWRSSCSPPGSRGESWPAPISSVASRLRSSRRRGSAWTYPRNTCRCCHTWPPSSCSRSSRAMPPPSGSTRPPRSASPFHPDT